VYKGVRIHIIPSSSELALYLQSIVALSNTEAEYIAMREAMKETILLQELLDDLRIYHDLLKINCDSMIAIYLAKNWVYHARMKHIDVRFHFVERFLIRVISS